MYWLPTTSPFNWPEAYGYVPGVDWFQAVDNARILWSIDMTYIVYAYEERTP